MSSHDPRPLSSADLVGLLAEPDRRRAFAALVLGARSIPEVASTADLPAREAAAAVQKLVSGGLATGDRGGRFEPLEEAFRLAVRTEQRVSAGPGDGAGSYFRRGRLTSIPRQGTTRAGVLGIVADAFDTGRDYTEAQVNALCAEWNDDWAGLRRALVDDGFLVRDSSGARYRRSGNRHQAGTPADG